jgi:ribosome-binding factor A
MQTIKQKRLGQIIMKDVTDIIQYDLKDPDVGFITVTGAKVSDDHSYATIYVTFLGKKERGAAGLKALDRAKGYIRSELAKRLDIRRCPEIIFEIDQTEEKAKHIEEIIQTLHQNDTQK